MSGTVARSTTGWRFVAIAQGDTLQSIALREMGDAARWIDLVSLNDLAHPYITGDSAVALASGGRVRLYGQTLRVFAPVAFADAALNPDAVFLTDIALEGGMLAADAGNLAVVSGRSNLRAGLSRRITTDRGELPFHPTYGTALRSMIGAVAGPTRGLLAARDARLAVERDRRIARVVEARATVAGDSVRVTVSAEPVAGLALLTLDQAV